MNERLRRMSPALILVVVALAGCGGTTPQDRALKQANAALDRCYAAMDSEQSDALIESACEEVRR